MVLNYYPELYHLIPFIFAKILKVVPSLLDLDIYKNECDGTLGWQVD